MATTSKHQTRGEFLRDLFQTNPGVSEREAARAWTAAGNEGTISPSSFYSARREFRGEAGATPAAPVTPGAGSASRGPKTESAPPPPVEARPEFEGEIGGGTGAGDRERVLRRVEDGIDELIFELKRLGGMEEVLEALRKVRRVVVRGHRG